jgi:hypothetical protein|tara:strand:- start:476 stop:604 length:129 start_codon:yes stop_codon:yes gene_type:complete
MEDIMAGSNNETGDDLAKKVYLITAISGGLFFAAAFVILKLL